MNRGYAILIVAGLAALALLGSIADSLFRQAAALDWIGKVCAK